MMDQYQKHQSGEKAEKIAIHCMAGVGRTGTLMALINSIICLKEQNDGDPKLLSIFSIIRRLREQRFEMCETQAQYKFLFDSIRQYFENDLDTISEAS